MVLLVFGNSHPVDYADLNNYLLGAQDATTKNKAEEEKMAKSKVKEIKWIPDEEEHDYLAAESYLRILYNEDRVADMIARFRSAAIVQFEAKDIFRASQLPMLSVSDSYVEKDKKKIREGISLSPILLLRDEPNSKVVIADGYHRLCAIYEFDEDVWIRCKII